LVINYNTHRSNKMCCFRHKTQKSHHSNIHTNQKNN